MTSTTNHTPTESQNELALQSLWIPGSSHSLCTQEPGTPFRTVGFFDSPRALLDAAAKLHTGNVWFGVNAMTKQRKGRGGANDVVSVVALCADYDWADPDAHKDADLPDELEVRRIVDSMVPSPTLVVESGHGVNLFWALTDELDAVTGRRLSDGFFRYMEAEYGLHNDRGDLASILRVPGTYNHKSEPVVEVFVARYDHDEGYVPKWIRDNAWLPEPGRPLPPAVAVRPGTPAQLHVGVADDRKLPTSNYDPTPKDWIDDNYDPYLGLMRLGWQAGPQRGDSEELTRPGKSGIHGTSATFHHDSKVCSIYTSTVDPAYPAVGKIGRDGQTLIMTPLDVWMVENGFSNVSDAMREIRKMMPRTPPPPTEREHRETEVEEPGRRAAPALNLPDSFWESRDVLAHIKQAAWSRSCSPDAVLAGVMARYSATVPPQVKLPHDGTLDLFFVVQGHSGSGKSKAGKCARAVVDLDRIKGVMMDRNVGSGEGLAEAFFEWIDEDGKPCGPQKKGATKVRTMHGLHFSTDEGSALQASAGRANSILIPTLCSAWMGEPIGHLLADPTKSRMIDPMTVRVSAEIRIQTAHGWKLFDEAFASTGLSQRMVCVSAIDPKISERFQDGFVPPEWPGTLRLARPTIIAGERILSYCPQIGALLAQEAAAVHDPSWSGSPLDTHRTLSALKLAGILCLWDDRTEISETDFSLASQIIDIHVANRNVLRATQTVAQHEARMTRVTLAAEQEVAVMNAKETEMLGKTVAFLRAKIRAGEYPNKRTLNAAKRAHFEDAKTLLEEEGVWPQSASRNPEGV
ncbi:hypothetical protein [Ilumatobacter sp.]|uniref:hypothetical protein n=1 Tax=Ilumatobacter sp. TaxID=1967498 RepID=UPI003751A289